MKMVASETSSLHTQPRTCGKCAAEMEEGFLLDRQDLGGAKEVLTWVSGKPDFGFLGLKTPGKLRVRSFRCTKCGYLESYATE